MIFTDRTVIVQKGTSSINDTIVLYRGDRDIEVRFTLNEGSPFKFGSGASPNIIEKTEAAYGQLIIKRPNDLPAVFSEIAPTNKGKIVFTITAEMIDEITEVGNYTFQIRLLDESRNSRATLPEVVNGIEIREPIATEDISDTNEVGEATVGYALTTAGTTEDAFDSQGNYNKTTWAAGDRITDAKLNKMEAGIDGVNKKVASAGTGGGSNIDDTTASATTTYSSNKIENIKENLNSRIKDVANELKNIGQPTDEQVNTAVSSYLENNPITIDDMWSDLVEGEVYNVKIPPKQTGISATFNQGDNKIYEDNTLDSLKEMLVVNKVYNDGSIVATIDYTLSGTLTIGTSTVTVTSGDYRTTFNVTVSEKPSATLLSISATYTQGDAIVYPSTSLDDLKANLIVTATYSDDTTERITNYTLSGTLTVGTSTVTVNYEELTTTFNVTVSKESGYVTQNLVVDYDLTKYEDGYTGEVADSISGIVADCGDLSSYTTGRNGFVGGKLMCNTHKTSGKNTYFKVPCSSYISQHPFSVELYIHIRTNYNIYASDGVLNFENCFALTTYIFLNTRTTETGSTAGYLGRLLLNTDNTEYFNLAYNTNYVNISSESLDVPYQDINNAGDGTYVHLIFCCNGENMNKIYYNGQLVASGTGSANAVLSNAGQFLKIESGDIKLVRIYQSLLGDDEAIKNYNYALDMNGGTN